MPPTNFISRWNVSFAFSYKISQEKNIINWLCLNGIPEKDKYGMTSLEYTESSILDLAVEI